MVVPSRAELTKAGNGSGFFITKDGYFVTNEHVIDDADAITVKTSEREFKARVIKADAQNDIAILKVEGEFQPLALGGDLDTTSGEEVFTIGFPLAHVLGESPKTTLGSITSLSGIRDDPRMFQISVQIQPGNSGGPLVLKSTGDVIGVTSSSFVSGEGSPVAQNVNYAMKASYIRPLMATIPGLHTKLPRPKSLARAWPEVQREVESAAGLVVIYKDEERAAPPQVMTPAPPPNPAPAANGPWVFPDSSQRLLTSGEVSVLSGDQLWRARNEIYARNGLIFSTAKGRAFAASLGPFYKGTTTNQDRVSARMNPIEVRNIELIKRFE